MTRPANWLSWLSSSVAWTTVMGFLLGQLNQCMTSCSGFKTVLRGWWLEQRVARGQTLHLMPALQQLHWVPVRQHVIYKLCLQVFKFLHGTAPSYLRELLHLHTRDRRLRPASVSVYSTVSVERGVGRAGFRVAGPAAWNTLPSSLRAADSLLGFKKQLKTYLWQSTF